MNLIIYLYRVFFLLVVVFDRVSCLHFSSDFVHRYLIFFERWCAIEWCIDHNFIILLCRVIKQYVKHVSLRRKDRFFDILLEKEKKWYPSDTKLVNFLSFMFSSSLWNLKSIGTCLGVRLCLIIKLAKSKISSKSTKNQFIEKYVFYVLAYYTTHSNDTIMIYISFDCVSSPEENEVSMNKIGWVTKEGDSIKDHDK